MIDINGIKLRSRLVVSSGALGFGRKWPHCWFFDPSELGAVTFKTVTRYPRKGNYRWWCPWKVLQKIPGGWCNCVGWTNPGIEAMIAKVIPKTEDINRIVNIGGFSIDEYLEMIEMLNPLKIAAVELNLSCPNVELIFENQLDQVSVLLQQAQAKSTHSLVIKVGLHQDYLMIAKMARDSGLAAVSAINAIKTDEGGISGPIIRDRALFAVSKITPIIPVIGGGGIYSWQDAKMFLNAGASAVSIGSMCIFYPPYQSFPFFRVRHLIEEERKNRLSA